MIASVGAVELISTTSVSAVIAESPIPTPISRGQQGHAGSERRPEGDPQDEERDHHADRLRARAPLLGRADHAARELDLQARLARRLGHPLERVDRLVLEVLHRDLEVKVGEDDAPVLRDGGRARELLARVDRLGDLARQGDRRLDHRLVLRLVERLPLGGGEHHPRRRAAASRELLVQEVERLLGLGPGHVERVALLALDGLAADGEQDEHGDPEAHHQPAVPAGPAPQPVQVQGHRGHPSPMNSWVWATPIRAAGSGPTGQRGGPAQAEVASRCCSSS
jgi:hypothetical protein